MGITLEKIIEAVKLIDPPSIDIDRKKYFMNQNDFLDLPLDSFKLALKLDITVRTFYSSGRIIEYTPKD